MSVFRLCLILFWLVVHLRLNTFKFEPVVAATRALSHLCDIVVRLALGPASLSSAVAEWTVLTGLEGDAPILLQLPGLGGDLDAPLVRRVDLVNEENHVCRFRLSAESTHLSQVVPRISTPDFH